MRSLIVLARLLDYPTEELQRAATEMQNVIADEAHLSHPQRAALHGWIGRIATSDLLDLQADYVALFDKGRSTSLLLFEHVHGESRDRGQAMVDLLEQYRQAGFELSARELPDYLPVFLEYLSARDEADIAQQLSDIAHILALLAARLRERESDHALVPTALLAMVGADTAIDEHAEAVSKEARDDTPAALDAVWEEEAVRFNAASDEDCALQSATGRRQAELKRQSQAEMPIRIVPPVVDATLGH
ncbi:MULTISPECIES: nitrate reductase molybdenum cofactor assembly chaperone [Chromohalobacter]|uniref:Nitrate reductase molybdenum cofactor assembly chaperone n=1 Tax=Chromohalobacter beijerinckii TaxID=86179 RepID=A0ABV8XGV9_9GAMM|nr:MULTISPECIES: nitrate reductase molybdenum cofactor assembly chaperone [Chromohalobacter]MCK0754235.1 nitrate reductase molybdenum cofactor assembly chaperone [Chromohalobacter japonicus]MCK0764967.1 nitrate reductase molybdenum cofactor assembly chaperone [Chromohalobacter beijerinckii]